MRLPYSRPTSTRFSSAWCVILPAPPVCGDLSLSSVGRRITIFSFTTPGSLTTTGWLSTGLRWLIAGVPPIALPVPGSRQYGRTMAFYRMPLSTYRSALRVVNPLTGAVGGASLIARAYRLQLAIYHLRTSSLLFYSARRHVYSPIAAIRCARLYAARQALYSYPVGKPPIFYSKLSTVRHWERRQIGLTLTRWLAARDVVENLLWKGNRPEWLRNIRKGV